ncbi:MAG: AAA family ATPase [Chloroflexi bacterium]|nr:AAA family ATPase [Chloroflexota bacterium]
MTAVPIVLPVPALVALVGAAGSGKTTLAERLFEPSEILSSDALREVVGGDAADQRATRAAFAILHRETRRRLEAGRLVVVDATNVERSARLVLQRMARLTGVPAIAIVIIGPAGEIHRRNAARIGRVVPPEIVDRHLARLAMLGPDPGRIRAALVTEGFATVHVVATADEARSISIARVVGSDGRRATRDQGDRDAGQDDPDEMAP